MKKRIAKKIIRSNRSKHYRFSTLYKAACTVNGRATRFAVRAIGKLRRLWEAEKGEKGETGSDVGEGD